MDGRREIESDAAPTIFNAPGIIAALAVAGTSLLLLCAWLANERRPDGAVRLPSLLMTLQVSSVLVASTGAWVLTYLSAHNSLHDTATQLVVVSGESVKARIMAVLSDGRKVATATQQRMELQAPGYPAAPRALMALYNGIADENVYAVYYGLQGGAFIMVMDDVPAGSGKKWGSAILMANGLGPRCNTTDCTAPGPGIVNMFAVSSDPSMWDLPERTVANEGYCESDLTYAFGDTVPGYYPNGSRGRQWTRQRKCGNLCCDTDNCCSFLYDPRARPWYHVDRKDHWAVYNFPWFDMDGRPIKGVTVSKTVWDASGRALGVVGVDFTVAGLSGFLRSNLPTPGSRIFVVEEDGALAATSFTVVPSGLQRVSEDWEWRDLFRNVEGRHGSISNATVAPPHIHYGNGGANLVMGVPIFDTRRWLLVIHVPYSDITGDAEDASVLALAIVVAAALCSGLALSAFIFRVLRPLQIVVGQMARVAQLQLDNLEQPPESFVRELQRLRDYYLGMVDALRYYRDFVPQSMMAGLDASDQGMSVTSETQAQRPLNLLSDTASTHSTRSSSMLSDVSRCMTRNASFGIGVPIDHRLAQRRVSLLTANIRRWLTSLETISVQELSSQHTEYVATCVDAVRAGRGIADSLLGDRVLMNFNGVRANGQHALRATQTALRIAQLAPDGLAVSSGLSSGKCLCGNMGAAGLKAYAIVGPPASMVHACERAATRWSLPCVSDRVVYQEVAFAIVCKLLCLISYRKGGSDAPAALFEPLHEAEAPSVFRNEEWMYQVAAVAPYQHRNAAAELLLSGGVNEAKGRCELHRNSEGIAELAAVIASAERETSFPTVFEYDDMGGLPECEPLKGQLSKSPSLEDRDDDVCAAVPQHPLPPCAATLSVSLSSLKSV